MKFKFLPFLLGVACVFLIAAGVARQPFYAAGPTLVQTGSSVATSDGTITNSFATAYSSAPKVVATQTGAALNTSTNIIIRITTTNFVLNSGLASVTNNWIAVGTP